MRVIQAASCLFLIFICCAVCFPQSGVPTEWLLTIDVYGNSLHQRLTLSIKGEELSGTLDGDALKGTISGNHLHFVATDKHNNTTELDAQLVSRKMNGELAVTLSSKPNEHINRSFSAYALEEKPARVPAVVEFAPMKFYNQFSADIEPVLTIWPGETIHTQTIDSGGVDEHGVTKALYGNPQTGPFYVGGAERGDVIAVLSSVFV